MRVSDSWIGLTSASIACLAFLQRALRALLVAAEVFFREAQEVLDVLAQLPAGEVIETAIELFHGAVERERAFCFDRCRAATSHPPAGAERERDGDARSRSGSVRSMVIRESQPVEQVFGPRQARLRLPGAGSSPSFR